ncbi:MAG: DUF485 domain-containing protein [Candidatus Sericytochromatia bacterium]|nr:DUF485 domain-containing protein [Candidatus Sericytochromatia bacterium]
MPITDAQLTAVGRKRTQMAVGLTAAMLVGYFGFIALIAFAKDRLGTPVVPGLSLGILLGALVIVAAWLLTWRYVHWANRTHDAAVAELRR